ncbi:Vacuolar protein-sorting-associated protein 33 [Coemansia sp. IMI 203386]|nr:Vacuolar protein-sorting-associated protein 33 [Coemansia sp. IMI 203386]
MQPSAPSPNRQPSTASTEATGEPALLQLKELLRDELISILDTVRGAKSLVLDKDLAGALSNIVDFAVLKDHGVEKVFLLESGPLTADPSALPTGIIYFTLPHVRKMKIVADQVRQLSASQSAGAQREFSLQLVPRRTLLCERVLEEEGVLGEITVSEYRMDFIPLENDLLSLELPATFKELYLDEDFSSIQCVARAIMRLQGLYGFFPRIVGKGDYAAILADSLARMRAEMLSSASASAAKQSVVSGSRGIAQGGVLAMSSVFDSVVIIDRAVDLVTPLLTQLTYEGLISEVFGIANGYVTLPSSGASTTATTTTPSATDGSALSSTSAAPNAGAQTTKRKRIALNSQDDGIFKEIRGMNFSSVGALLSKMSRQLQDTYESRHKAKTVQEIRSFVGKLGNLQAEHQSLKTHVMLAETIVKRTQSDDFDSLLDIEQTLVNGSDLTKDQLAYVEKIMALADPLANGPGVADAADARAADSGNQQQAKNTIHKVLRVLCLYSLCRGPANLKQKVYDAWYDDVLAAFGHHQTITMDNLAKVGLLVPPSYANANSAKSANPGGGNPNTNSSNSIGGGSGIKLAAGSVSDTADGVDNNSGLLNRLIPSTRPRNPAHTNSLGFLRKSLNLIVSDVRESDPDDVSYVYSGYAPLSIRLLQCLVRDSAVYSTPTASRYASLLLRPLNMTLQASRGSAQTANQTEDGGSGSNSVHQNIGGVKSGWSGWEDVLNELPGENIDVLQSPSDCDSDAVTADAMIRRLGEKAPATLVVFLGGCTHTEIAALRLLSQQHNHKYIAATTQIINGNSFLDPLIQHQA